MKYYCFDDTFWNSIDSDTKAYWLQFAQADGHVSKDGYSFVLHLGNEDYSHLEKFRRAILSNHPIKVSVSAGENHPTSACIFLMCGKEWIDSLAQYDLVYLKRETRKWLTDLPFQTSLLRGEFDANGSIHIKDNGGRFSISANKQICEGAMTVLMNNGLREQRLFIPNKESMNSWRFEYTAKDDLVKIYEILYTGAEVWMDRKRSKFEQIIGER